MFVESFSVSILPDALTLHTLLHSRSREAVKVHLLYAYEPRGVCVCAHVCRCVFLVCVYRCRSQGISEYLCEWTCRVRGSISLFPWVGLRRWGPMDLGESVCL